MNISALRSAIASALETVDGLNVYPKAVDSPSPPCAMVLVPTVGEFFNPYEAMAKGLASWRFVVRLLARKVDVKNGQDDLDRWLSMGTDADGSVLNALAADPTFGGVVDTSKFGGEINGYGLFTVGSTDFLGTDIPLIVYASRK